ncbi:hypothetical protein CHU17_001434 [Salmonella enterica subsp. enterica serovar Minnesota]|nr:hypothetical protein [Salmonella enterica subsp. enterica serovar Minnesota]
MTDIEKDIEYLSLKLSATERVQELLIHLLILKETISASEAQKLLDEEYKRIPEDIPDPSYKNIIFQCAINCFLRLFMLNTIVCYQTSKKPR